MKKLISLTALLSSYVPTCLTLKYDMKFGKCPIKAGDINSNVKEDFDHDAITGNWINIFDRKFFNKHLKCYAI